MSTIEKLGAHEVAAWLRRQPKFLQQFPDLALSLVVPREDGPAASLASYELLVRHTFLGRWLNGRRIPWRRRAATAFAPAE